MTVTVVMRFSSGFNTQPPEGGWLSKSGTGRLISVFQHTAARRRLGSFSDDTIQNIPFQHTAARRRLVLLMKVPNAMMKFQHTAARRRLVAIDIYAFFATCCFNTQPPEGGWLNPNRKQVVDTVSTHSRPKAAGAES